MLSHDLGPRSRLIEQEVTDLARANGQFADGPRHRHHVAQRGGFDHLMLRLARWVRRRVTRAPSED